MAVVRQRVTADVEGDFVVFIIGMRINRVWKVHKWLPVAKAMNPMVAELSKDPESGFLGASSYLNWRGVTLVQYWRSWEQLERYSRDREAKHFPAWVAFNKSVGSNGDVGIWHETYKVAAGAYETVYNNMPPYGLAAATKAVPAAGYRTTATGRMTGGTEAAEYPEEAPLPR
ncbi:MAG TPA: DUF4188 domain-containing protein [Tepidiformaceae bacterium]